MWEINQFLNGAGGGFYIQRRNSEFPEIKVIHLQERTFQWKSECLKITENIINSSF